MIQYGQLFLSWNSGSFDFYLNRKDGVEQLVRGKYLLFISISVICFLASVPYVYFGWQILLVHIATFFIQYRSLDSCHYLSGALEAKAYGFE